MGLSVENHIYSILKLSFEVLCQGARTFGLFARPRPLKPCYLMLLIKYILIRMSLSHSGIPQQGNCWICEGFCLHQEDEEVRNSTV